MDNQYYYKLMASYLSKRNCDESFMRYFFGKNSLKKTTEELEKADERKRRLQRERSRRYRALKNARRQNESGSRDSGDSDHMRSKSHTLMLEEEFSDCDEPPTLCDLTYDDKWRETGPGSSDCASDDNSAHSAAELKEACAGNVSISLKDFLSSPNAELDYQTVHSLMFHWLQT
ncbi:hypothetical protein JYU34_009088 [Plutella xylostella]|uniref:Uncharacterized protein n=2 Tax=Plutella xylostella TaxID=51655 RepID=A0ABQ7QMK1_PLUXY|nr:uncharacterized protein LOC125489277 [Plutella xylostella]KAG7306452.1 hypothetical protein JYU34_009088 [Plutella xylostella]CAG9113619.1 unnamed protein product [Plutella xylostella]